MKKFTSFMLMLLCAVTTWAGVTDLPEMSTDGDIKWYTIKNVRKQKFATYAGDDATMTQQASATAASFFYFTGSIEDGVKIHNYAAGDKLCASYNSWTESGIKWYLKAQSTGVSICTSTGEWNAWNDAGGGGQKVEYWSASDAGSAWEISLVTDFTSIINVPAAKDAAKAELNNLKQLPLLFTESEINAAIAEVEGVTAVDNSLAALNAAVEQINAIIYAGINGKCVKFASCTDANDTRHGKYLGYDKTNSRPAGVSSTGDDVIWTLKASKYGFKLYNWVSNTYMGAPADPTPAVAAEEAAPSFKFIVTAENQVALVCTNGNMAHLANRDNNAIISYYSTTDKASLWSIIPTDPIVVTHEEYNIAAEAKEKLPYAIQEAYGLVTDASKYYSNYKSDAEGSYAALLDNTIGTYFHSAYGSEAGDGSNVHYIQADLGEGNSIDKFYFYMLPRSGNGNNRPKNITVSGSNSLDEPFVEIAQITTTLDSSMTPYVSTVLGTEGANYRYIRLTVTSTNTGTKFFTLGELYLYPATEDVTNLIDSYNTFSTASITTEAFSTAASQLVNAETTLALSNIKKEIAAILAANAENHATTPALGQYTTTAYNALSAAYSSADATQESLEESIASFNKAKNVPVYFITSAWDGGYSAGSAILYNGSAWRWAAADKYNKQMWMTIPSYTNANVPVADAYDANGTSYAICDYLTNNVMRGKQVQIVKIEGWDGAYNLQYNANAESTDAAHHAQSGGNLVNWKPAVINDCQASAWRVEYIGSSYDLDNLTDEKIAALGELKAAYTAKKVYENYEVGTAVGQYSGNKEAIIAALEGAEIFLDATLAQQATATVENINAATTALNNAAVLEINLPIGGRYYRIAYNYDGVLKYVQAEASGVQDKENAMLMSEDNGAASIFYFSGSSLLSYTAGKYIKEEGDERGLDGNTMLGGVNAADVSFEAGSVAGTIAVKAPSYMHANSHDGIDFIDHCGGAGHNAHNFIIEEVESLPVTITAAGYATFYAPVEVSADGVEAYYTTGEKVEGHETYLNMVAFQNNVIPALQGAILKGEQGEYEFAINYNAPLYPNHEGNLLCGTIETANIAKEEGYTYYVLANHSTKGVGLYQPTSGSNTTFFRNASHKAYMKVAGAAQTAGYSFSFDWNGTTGIENIEGATEATNAVIYDITGRQIKAIVTPGIYIINGKKTFVK